MVLPEMVLLGTIAEVATNWLLSVFLMSLAPNAKSDA